MRFIKTETSDMAKTDRTAKISCLRYLLRKVLFLFLVGSVGGMAAAATPGSSDAKATTNHAHKHARLDRSGKARKGKASYYGREFYGKKMANGKAMNPHSNVAASKTLPLGTKAKVTNLETGKSAVVDIEDRGPYVDGRIIDLSPKTAEKLEFKKEGVAPVVVKPLVVPQEDASAKVPAEWSSSGSP
jgi:rare lipoprotein A